MLQAKPLLLKEISEVKLESLNENEAYLCIDDFGTPAFITGKSLKEVKHPEVKYILVPFKQYILNDADIHEHYEISESQCQDPYCISKQEGQIQGAKWGRNFNPPVAINISDGRIKEYFNNYRTRFQLVRDEEIFALDYNAFVVCIKAFFRQSDNTNEQHK